MGGPLSGIRIVMMAGLGPGPFAGMVLGDLGADVIRVDRIEEVDQTEFVDRVVRRSQRSIAVDVKDARGAELVRTLVTGADAFVDVFRPGALERIGLGPDDLLARNARLIYARMTGYGQDGPLAPMAGHDINYLAMSGALHAIGTADLPLPPLNLVGDYGGGGMLLAVGLLSGILEARQSVSYTHLDVYKRQIRVHLKGTFAPSHHAAAYWRERSKEGETNDARLINTTSVSGLYANAGQGNYGAAKAGIAAFTQIAAVELGRYGVTANCIAPGALTRMTGDLDTIPDEVRANFAPTWVAPVVTWLASPDSAEVTGQVIEASGVVLAVAEGWHRGPSSKPVESAEEVGSVVRKLLADARPRTLFNEVS